jgi:hypothetical protein
VGGERGDHEESEKQDRSTQLHGPLLLC